MQTHSQYIQDTTHTHPYTDPWPHMFPLLSSHILEFITEKDHPCFLLLKPDVSISSLPVFCFSPLCGPILFIVMWSGELVGFFRAMNVCAWVSVLMRNLAFFPLFHTVTADWKASDTHLHAVWQDSRCFIWAVYQHHTVQSGLLSTTQLIKELLMFWEHSRTSFNNPLVLWLTVFNIEVGKWRYSK